MTPGILPATMIVAPNSPRLRANIRDEPARIPRNERGRITVKSVSYQGAPRVRDAWMSCGSMDSMPIRMDRTNRGKPTTAEAITAAFQVNMSRMPTDSRSGPSHPFFPSRRSKK